VWEWRAWEWRGKREEVLGKGGEARGEGRVGEWERECGRST